jgi:predicted nucleotidyltransferase
MLTRKATVELLAQNRSVLESFGLRRLALFGSVARDTAGPASDVDFFVEFEGAPTFDRYIELSFYLESLLSRPVDLVTQASLQKFLSDDVEQEAIDVQGLSTLPR